MSAGGPKTDLTASTAEGGALAARLASTRSRAAYVLWAERLWPALLPPAGLLGLYTLAGLLRLPQSLPDGLRLVLLLVVMGLCGWWAWRRLRALTAPSPASIDRRIEQASHLRNRPLATLTDTPVRASAQATSVLWEAHQQRVLASLGTLRAGWPHLLPRTLPGRAALVLLPVTLGATALLVGPSAPGRVLAAFLPGTDDPDVPLPHLEAWITAPAYAPEAPIFLGAGAQTTPQVAEGARLTAIVSGVASPPQLRTANGLVLRNETRQQLDAHSWKLTATLTHGGTLRLRARGRMLAQWPVTVLPDAAPQAQWGPNPGARKGEWRTYLPYAASHAYGLSSLEVSLQATHPGRGADTARRLTVPIPLTGHPRSTKGEIAPDLSEDPWAGLEVTGNIVAHSVSGREGKSAPATFRLGARVFHAPLARAILDVRRRFALGQENRADTATDLETLGTTPGPLREHTGMFLNLAAVIAILEDNAVDTQTARTSTTNLLWDLALDIEDRRTGDDASAQASIDIRAAQAAVAQQLARLHETGKQDQNAQAELETRLQTLKEAISRKMQAMAQAALRNNTAIPDLSGLSDAGNKAFSRLMKQLRSDAMNGRAEDALKRLQDMESATERMRNATPQDMADLARQMLARQKAQEQMAALNDLSKKQMSLLDHAQSRLDENQRARDKKLSDLADDGDGEAAEHAGIPMAELLQRLGIGNTAGSAPAPAPQDQQTQPSLPDPAKAEQQAAARRTERATQHALEQALDELQNEFHALTGKTPDAFPTAHDSMHAARKALADGNDASAAQAQTKALEALNKSRQQMRDIMQNNGKNSPPSFLPAFGSPSEGDDSGQGGTGSPQDSADDGAQEQGRSADKRDPLGRKLGEGQDQTEDDSTHIPDTVARQKAREIEQELRRRDSDRTRPQQELEYLDRLLKPF